VADHNNYNSFGFARVFRLTGRCPSARQQPGTSRYAGFDHCLSPRQPLAIFSLERAVILNALSKRVPSVLWSILAAVPGIWLRILTEISGLKIVGLDNSILAVNLAKQAWHKEINVWNL